MTDLKFIRVGEGWVAPALITAVVPIYRWRNEGKERYTIGSTIHFDGGTTDTDEMPGEFIARWSSATRDESQDAS